MYRFKDGNRYVTIFHTDLVKSLGALKALLWRAEENRPIPYKDLGICANWDSEFSYFLVLHYGSQWPKSAHPGERHSYPVGGNRYADLWEGTNRELRIDLMRFIVSKLEQLIEEDPQ